MNPVAPVSATFILSPCYELARYGSYFIFGFFFWNSCHHFSAFSFALLFFAIMDGITHGRRSPKNGVPRDALENLLAAIPIAEQVMPFRPITPPVTFTSSWASIIEVLDELRHSGKAEFLQFDGGVRCTALSGT